MNPLQQGAESSKFLQDDWFQKFMESVRKVPLDNIKVKLPKDLREDHVEGPTGPEEEDVDDIKDPTVFEEPKFGTDVAGPMVLEEDDIDNIEYPTVLEGSNIGAEFLHECSKVFSDFVDHFPVQERNSQLDFICRLSSQTIAMVEVQVIPQDFWDKRAVY